MYLIGRPFSTKFDLFSHILYLLNTFSLFSKCIIFSFYAAHSFSLSFSYTFGLCLSQIQSLSLSYMFSLFIFCLYLIHFLSFHIRYLSLSYAFSLFSHTYSFYLNSHTHTLVFLSLISPLATLMDTYLGRYVGRCTYERSRS